MLKIDNRFSQSCFINQKKKYMVKKIQMLSQARDIAVKINQDSNGAKYINFSDAYSELIKRGFEEKNDGKFKPPKPKCNQELKKKGKKKHQHDPSDDYCFDASQEVCGWIAVDIIGENYLNKLKARKEWKSQCSRISRKKSDNFDVNINVYV